MFFSTRAVFFQTGPRRLSSIALELFFLAGHAKDPEFAPCPELLGLVFALVRTSNCTFCRL